MGLAGFVRRKSRGNHYYQPSRGRICLTRRTEPRRFSRNVNRNALAGDSLIRCYPQRISQSSASLSSSWSSSGLRGTISSSHSRPGPQVLTTASFCARQTSAFLATKLLRIARAQSATCSYRFCGAFLARRTDCEITHAKFPRNGSVGCPASA